MKKFIDFIRTQGIVGLAVGFILGGAITGLVTALSTDIINPIVGIILGDFGDLSSFSIHVGSATIAFGAFLTVFINFCIIAAIVYLGISRLGLNKLDKPKETVIVEPKK
jgi:large conductance mechanosensitive channel